MDRETREALGQTCAGIVAILFIAIVIGTVVVPLFSLWDGRVGAIVAFVGFVAVLAGAIWWLMEGES